MIRRLNWFMPCKRTAALNRASLCSRKMNNICVAVKRNVSINSFCSFARTPNETWVGMEHLCGMDWNIIVRERQSGTKICSLTVELPRGEGRRRPSLLRFLYITFLRKKLKIICFYVFPEDWIRHILTGEPQLGVVLRKSCRLLTPATLTIWHSFGLAWNIYAAWIRILLSVNDIVQRKALP